MASDQTALKHLFGKAHLERIVRAFERTSVGKRSQQLFSLERSLSRLEMKPRVHLIRDAFKEFLPADFPEALTILLEATEQGDLRGFDLWPLTEYIQKEGLHHRQESLEGLKILTTRFTSEFAVRPFLAREPVETLRFLLKCSTSKDVHVRRWASEGSRPRLPWGERLRDFVADPQRTAEILERLKFDPELYVRKSVANHLNDIAKDHPKFVIQTLRRWRKSARDDIEKKHLEWITHRSLRTLIKDGHSEALALIGVSSKARLTLHSFVVKKRNVVLGGHLEFEISLSSRASKTQKLVIDYVIHHRRANGTFSPKVFKLRSLNLAPKQKLKIAKKHPVRAITTRSYYSGEQRLALQINGKELAATSWLLKT